MKRGVSSTLLASSAHVKTTNFRNCSVDGNICGSNGLECIVEIVDLVCAVPGDGNSEAWAVKAKMMLREMLKKYGPILEIKMPTSITKVRFGSSRSIEAVMKAAPRGYLTMGEGEIRLRLPGSLEPVWHKFPPPRKLKPVIAQATQTLGESAPKKRKMRPNERFATRLPCSDELDESERFWEEQHKKRNEVANNGMPPLSPPKVHVEEISVLPEPERPIPNAPGPKASAEDNAVFEGEKDVAAAMGILLEQPFSQQRKKLKALRRQWHPDKRPDDQEVATRVFQFIQAHDVWLAHHGLE